MRVTLIASFTLLSIAAVTASACGGDDFSPGASAGGASGTAGNTSKGGTSSGGANANGGTAGAGTAGTAGSNAGGAAGSSTAKACETGADCGKADPCIGVPYCSNHTCFLDTSGVPSIEDGNACTKDACNSVTGLPTHTPLPVGDGNPCTKDTCDPATGPAHVVDPACTGCKSDEECDDGDPCTEDTCTNTKCASQAKPAGAECGAGDACSAKSACDAKGACKAGAPKIIDDDDECTVDSCDPQTGDVKHEPRGIDDKNACTADACDPSKGITHLPISFDDGDACTTDTCEPMKGPVHTPIVLGDGDPCTTDSCDKKTGPKYEKDPACDGKCKSDAQCADTNPCTKDICNAAGACEHPNDDGAACDDKKFCTTGDKCVAGVCQGGGPLPVDDGKPCTVDSCDEDNDQIVNAPVVVDDGNVCTQDSCDASGKVINSVIAGCCLNDAFCEQTIGGSEQGVCRKPGGTCLPGNTCQKHPETPIDDGDACTKDECNMQTGQVSHVVVMATSTCCVADSNCPGGNINGRCLAQGTCDPKTHACTPGADGGVIDDGNKCTTDVCLPSGKVDHQPVSGMGCCTDDGQCQRGGEIGNLCVPHERCQQGQCVSQGSGAPNPGQDTMCTKYLCDPSDGHWEPCCQQGGAECIECPLVDPASVCGGTKQ